MWERLKRGPKPVTEPEAPLNIQSASNLPVDSTSQTPAEIILEVNPLLTQDVFSYHQTKNIIEEAINKYGVELGGQELTPISYSREKSTSKIKFNVCNGVNMLPFLTSYLNTIGEARIKSYYKDIRIAKEDGLGVVLNEATFYSPATVEFSKDKDLEAEEIETVINIYKLANPPEKKRNPIHVLESLGATIFNPDDAPNWEYLAGYDGVKQQVKETVILALKNPTVYEQIARNTRKVYESNRPKAVLFEGPPGTGKTTMARIIAGEVDTRLVYVPVESIVSKWYGDSEKNLATIFSACEDLEAILFLDEIDSLATSRDGNIHEATRRVLSVLLRSIDGFNPNEKTILIGATNRKNDLDAALLSRFDTTIEFPRPNLSERQHIFENYAMHLTGEELMTLALESEGMSGRDIKNHCERVERSFASDIILKTQTINQVPNEMVVGVPSLQDYLAQFKLS